MQDKFSGEYFYVCLPVFDVVDDAHYVLLKELSISVRSVSFTDIKNKVTDFYNKFYGLFNLSFEDEMEGITLF